MTPIDCRPFRRQPLRSLAMLVLLALAACAGRSPEIKPTSADASATATASGGATDGSAAAAAAAAAGTPEENAESADAADSAAGTAAPEAAAAAGTPAEEAEAAAADAAAADAASSEAAVEPPAAIEAPPEPEAAPEVEAAEPVAEPAPPPPALAAAPSTPAGVGPPGSGLATGRPYVVIRFTDDAGDYEPALAAAVRRAVERRPNVAFDLVAVTPRANNTDDLADDMTEAEAQAAAVMKSLAGLGIGPDRVSMRAWTGQPTGVNEIRLYIR